MSHVIFGRAYSVGGKVSVQSQSAQCAIAVGSECLYAMYGAIQYTRTEHCFAMAKTFFPGVEEHCGLW